MTFTVTMEKYSMLSFLLLSSPHQDTALRELLDLNLTKADGITSLSEVALVLNFKCLSETYRIVYIVKGSQKYYIKKTKELCFISPNNAL